MLTICCNLEDLLPNVIYIFMLALNINEQYSIFCVYIYHKICYSWKLTYITYFLN